MVNGSKRESEREWADASYINLNTNTHKELRIEEHSQIKEKQMMNEIRIGDNQREIIKMNLHMSVMKGTPTKNSKKIQRTREKMWSENHYAHKVEHPYSHTKNKQNKKKNTKNRNLWNLALMDLLHLWIMFKW